MVKDNVFDTLKNVWIRQFRASDLAAVQKLFCDGFRYYEGTTKIASIYFVAEKLKDDMGDIEKHYLEIDGGNFWVAEEINSDFSKIVGCIGIQPKYSKASSNIEDDKNIIKGSKKLYELQRMFVEESYHGKGLASLLVKTLEKFVFEERNGDEIYLYTGCDMEKACRFYEKMDYVRSGVEHINLRDYYGDDAPDVIHSIQRFEKTNSV